MSRYQDDDDNDDNKDPSSIILVAPKDSDIPTTTLTTKKQNARDGTNQSNSSSTKKMNSNTNNTNKSNVSGSIRVLVCSANLGNAKPDMDSIDAWIPNDGYCRYALHDNPQYPLVLKRGDLTNTPPPTLPPLQTISLEGRGGTTATTSATNTIHYGNNQYQNPYDTNNNVILSSPMKRMKKALNKSIGELYNGSSDGSLVLDDNLRNRKQKYSPKSSPRNQKKKYSPKSTSRKTMMMTTTNDNNNSNNSDDSLSFTPSSPRQRQQQEQSVPISPHSPLTSNDHPSLPSYESYRLSPVKTNSTRNMDDGGTNSSRFLDPPSSRTFRYSDYSTTNSNSISSSSSPYNNNSHTFRLSNTSTTRSSSSTNRSSAMSSPNPSLRMIGEGGGGMGDASNGQLQPMQEEELDEDDDEKTSTTPRQPPALPPPPPPLAAAAVAAPSPPPVPPITPNTPMISIMTATGDILKAKGHRRETPTVASSDPPVCPPPRPPPLPFSTSSSTGTTTTTTPMTTHSHEKFDIIVIGLQEATFKVHSGNQNENEEEEDRNEMARSLTREFSKGMVLTGEETLLSLKELKEALANGEVDDEDDDEDDENDVDENNGSENGTNNNKKKKTDTVQQTPRTPKPSSKKSKYGISLPRWKRSTKKGRLPPPSTSSAGSRLPPPSSSSAGSLDFDLSSQDEDKGGGGGGGEGAPNMSANTDVDTNVNTNVDANVDAINDNLNVNTNVDSISVDASVDAINANFNLDANVDPNLDPTLVLNAATDDNKKELSSSCTSIDFNGVLERPVLARASTAPETAKGKSNTATGIINNDPTLLTMSTSNEKPISSAPPLEVSPIQGLKKKMSLMRASHQAAKGTIKVSQQAAMGTIKVSQQAAMGTIKVSQQAAKGTIKVSQQAAIGTLKVSQQAAKGTIKVSTQAAKGTIKVSTQAAKGTIKVSTQAAKGTYKVSQQAAMGTYKVSQQAAMGTVKVASKPIKATMKASKAVSILTTDRDHNLTQPASGGGGDSTRAASNSVLPLLEGNDMAEFSDTAVLHYLLEDQLPSYTRAVSYQRGEMRLIVYYLDSAIDLDVLSVKAQSTGRAGLANKGGIMAEVAVNKSTRLAFCTAHLEAHEGRAKYATRCSTIADILKGTESSVPSCRYDASLASHFSFFMGDLNFRTRLEQVEPSTAAHIKATHDIVTKAFQPAGSSKPDGPSIAREALATLNQADELGHALRVKDCLVGFLTPYCNFPPTFKVSRQPGYHYNDKRSPSYTDRILYKASDQLSTAIQPLLYEPIDVFATSDHKPIRGAFSIDLNSKLKWRPVLAPRTGAGRRLKRPLFRRGGMGAGRSEEPEAIQPAQRFVQESLHMFVTSISCKINRSVYASKRMTNDYSLEQVPCPYVCFVSTPSDAVHKEASRLVNLRDRLQGKIKKIPLVPRNVTKTLRRKLRHKKEQEIEMSPTIRPNSDEGPERRKMEDWPRTKKLNNTYQPSWGHDDEVYFKVRTHRVDGMPIDLSGSMLHITLMDGRGGGAGKVIGTFTLNLAKVIETSRDPNSSGLQSHNSRATSAAHWLSSNKVGKGGSTAFRMGARGVDTPARKAAQASLRKGSHQVDDSSELEVSSPEPAHSSSSGRNRFAAIFSPGKNAQKDEMAIERGALPPPPLRENVSHRIARFFSSGKNDGMNVKPSDVQGADGPNNDFITPDLEPASIQRPLNQYDDTSVSSSFMTAGPSDRLREAMNTNILASRAVKGAKRNLRRQSILNSEHSGDVSPPPSPVKQPRKPLSVPGLRSSMQSTDSFSNMERGNMSFSKLRFSSQVEDDKDDDDGDETSPSHIRRHRPLRHIFHHNHHQRETSSRVLNVVEDPLDSLKIISLKLDEPLMKNGKEVGRITCNIDAWWMEDDYSKEQHQQHMSSS